ncbi:MAG: hypothetical protein PUG50_02570 [Eubacteriales bacterium]|nr:hypothetical protein [Fenollaria sp.]MDD7339451.1 hypothetical protein [Eubacteriales bacterium]MDY3105284.1 hypothetical protein [Fenollaria sp.]
MLAELDKITYENVDLNEKDLMLSLEEVLATGCGAACDGCGLFN